MCADTTTPGSCRLAAERGSVLLLLPAGVLVLLLLGAFAVDFAVVFLAQREVANATAAAANDAAVAALDRGAFYDGGRLVIDEARAREVAVEAYAARRADYLDGGVTSVRVGPGAAGQVQVAVEGVASVDMIFSKALPGAPDRRAVRALAIASAVPGP